MSEIFCASIAPLPLVFPADITVGTATVHVQADGTVRGDRVAFAAALSNARAYSDDVVGTMLFVTAAMLLNAPWVKDDAA